MAATGGMSPSPKRCRVVVLISGRGSNLHAILDAIQAGTLPIDVVAVISNRPQAQGLQHAQAAGITTEVVDHRSFKDRNAFDHALQQRIDHYQPQLVVLAGFMRVLGAAFIEHYAGRLINIHPSLLPAFPGLHTHERAITEGAKRHGASVHFVTQEVDGGPIIVQASIPVLSDDTAESLAARVLEQEHRIYPLAIRWFAEGRLSIRDGKALLDGRISPEQGFET